MSLEFFSLLLCQGFAWPILWISDTAGKTEKRATPTSTVTGDTRLESFIDIQQRASLTSFAISERDEPGGGGFSVPSVILIAASSEVLASKSPVSR